MKIAIILTVCFCVAGCATLTPGQTTLKNCILQKQDLTGLYLGQIKQMFGRPHDYRGQVNEDTGQTVEIIWYVAGELWKGTLPKNQLLMIKLYDKKVVKFVYY